jgi:hypothetical protein
MRYICKLDEIELLLGYFNPYQTCECVDTDVKFQVTLDYTNAKWNCVSELEI